MALQSADTISSAPIPDTKRVIHATSDKLNLIELQSTQCPSVTLDATNLFTSLKVPYASGAVIRTGDENREGKVRKSFAELHAHDTVGVPLQCLYGTSTPSPITLYL